MQRPPSDMKMSEEIPSKYKTLFARVNAENSKSKSDAIKSLTALSLSVFCVVFV